ncbi:MAG: hypothetical protein WBE80_15675, partial [Methylocella sp.]
APAAKPWPSPPGRTWRIVPYVHAANWPGFAPPRWPAFTPPLTFSGKPRTFIAIASQGGVQLGFQ